MSQLVTGTLTGFPVGVTVSTSITVGIRRRTAEGSGSYGSFPGVPDLVLVFPNGRDDAKSLAEIRDLVHQHLMNYVPAQNWWSPASGSVEANLRAVCNEIELYTSGSSRYVWIMFDGQFGPVMWGP